MNKRTFIRTLEKELNYSNSVCLKINNILENNFFLSYKNKDKIIAKFIEKLNVTSNEALNIYNVSLKILKANIIFKIKHPFKNKSKKTLLI